MVSLPANDERDATANESSVEAAAPRKRYAKPVITRYTVTETTLASGGATDPGGGDDLFGNGT
jgi:hypothetical protein